MNFIDFLSGWWAGWSLNRESVLSLELRVGSAAYDKRSASLAAESSICLGYVTVWDTGEFEAEVLIIETQRRVYVQSAVIETPPEFAQYLAKFVRACESAAESQLGL